MMNDVLTIVWFLATAYVLRSLAFGAAALLRRQEFEVPYGDTIRRYPPGESPLGTGETLQRLTEEMSGMGFCPVSDHLDREARCYFTRLFLGEDGTVVFVTPPYAPGNPHDATTFVFLTRLANGEILYTTNIPQYSTWMDCIQGRRTVVVDAHLPFLEVYGAHSVRLSMERSVGIKPYAAETLYEEVLAENNAAYAYFEGEGYYRRDDKRGVFVPTGRFLVAYTLGIASPGRAGGALLAVSLVASLTGAAAFLM